MNNKMVDLKKLSVYGLLEDFEYLDNSKRNLGYIPYVVREYNNIRPDELKLKFNDEGKRLLLEYAESCVDLEKERRSEKLEMFESLKGKLRIRKYLADRKIKKDYRKKSKRLRKETQKKLVDCLI